MTVIPDLFEVQIGKETTWGTGVTPTAKLGLVEECEISPDVVVELYKEQRGSLAPNYIASLNKVGVGVKMSGTASYEDLPYILDGMLGEATPSGANPYVYAYTAPLGTAPTRRKFSIVKKQSGASYRVVSAMLAEAKFSVASGESLKYDLTFVGKSVASNAGASLSDRTVVPIQASHGSLYMDTWAGTIGSTQVTAPAWFSWELELKTNLDNYFGIGSINPVGYREAAWEGTMKVALEAQVISTGLLDGIIGGTLAQRQFRTRFTTGASAIAQFDFAGTFSKAPEMFSDADGVTSLEFEMGGTYNPTLANWLAASVTNTVATLP